jgi:hypothetical protein
MASDIKRPIPENKAIETNWLDSDFFAVSVEAEIGVETRIAVGMSGSPKHLEFKIPRPIKCLCKRSKGSTRRRGTAIFS